MEFSGKTAFIESRTSNGEHLAGLNLGDKFFFFFLRGNCFLGQCNGVKAYDHNFDFIADFFGVFRFIVVLAIYFFFRKQYFFLSVVDIQHKTVVGCGRYSRNDFLTSSELQLFVAHSGHCFFHSIRVFNFCTFHF